MSTRAKAKAKEAAPAIPVQPERMEEEGKEAEEEREYREASKPQKPKSKKRRFEEEDEEEEEEGKVRIPPQKVLIPPAPGEMRKPESKRSLEDEFSSYTPFQWTTQSTHVLERSQPRQNVFVKITAKTLAQRIYQVTETLLKTEVSQNYTSFIDEKKALTMFKWSIDSAIINRAYAIYMSKNPAKWLALAPALKNRRDSIHSVGCPKFIYDIISRIGTVDVHGDDIPLSYIPEFTFEETFGSTEAWCPLYTEGFQKYCGCIGIELVDPVNFKPVTGTTFWLSHVIRKDDFVSVYSRAATVDSVSLVDKIFAALFIEEGYYYAPVELISKADWIKLVGQKVVQQVSVNFDLYDQEDAKAMHSVFSRVSKFKWMKEAIYNEVLSVFLQVYKRPVEYFALRRS